MELLNDEEILQSYFIRRWTRILKSTKISPYGY